MSGFKAFCKGFSPQISRDGTLKPLFHRGFKAEKGFFGANYVSAAVFYPPTTSQKAGAKAGDS